MAQLDNQQMCLVRRPQGRVTPDDFALETRPRPSLNPGEVLLRNRYLSIDPAIRQWIGGRGRYITPITPGDAVRSVVIGEVVESANDRYPVGAQLRALGAWETFSRITQRDFPTLLPEVGGFPLTYHLGVLGNTGLAAYFGIHKIGRPRPGETVLVSAAAGAVGSVAAQLARTLGCRTVGIAGTVEKCRWLTEACGLDAAIPYRETDLHKSLHTHCPDGVDLYFDNVGGETLEAALGRLARGGRVVLCGATAQYQVPDCELRGPRNYLALLEKGGRMEGFMTSQFLQDFPNAVAALSVLLRDGALVAREERMEGLAAAPQALCRLFDGTAFGKLIVTLPD